MYFGVRWKEPRFFGPDPPEKNPYVPIDIGFVNNLWVPDVYIYHLKTIEVLNIFIQKDKLFDKMYLPKSLFQTCEMVKKLCWWKRKQWRTIFKNWNLILKKVYFSNLNQQMSKLKSSFSLKTSKICIYYFKKCFV